MRNGKHMSYRTIDGVEHLVFIPRERTNKRVAAEVEPEFYDRINEYCKENQIRVSQFVRYALSRAMAQD